MKKALTNLVTVGSLIITGNLLAADPIEVNHLIKCEDGFTVMGMAQSLNGAMAKGVIYSSDAEGNMLSIHAPFDVSAPTLMKIEGNGTVARMCVTVSKR